MYQSQLRRYISYLFRAAETLAQRPSVDYGGAGRSGRFISDRFSAISYWQGMISSQFILLYYYSYLQQAPRILAGRFFPQAVA